LIDATTSPLRSFDVARFDAPSGNTNWSPDAGVPPVQLPLTDQRLLTAPVQVFVAAAAVRGRRHERQNASRPFMFSSFIYGVIP
jgi:hypothetical protein